MLRDYKLYLEDILESIDRINEYVSGMTYEEFISDRFGPVLLLRGCAR